MTGADGTMPTAGPRATPAMSATIPARGMCAILCIAAAAPMRSAITRSNAAIRPPPLAELETYAIQIIAASMEGQSNAGEDALGERHLIRIQSETPATKIAAANMVGRTIATDAPEASLQILSPIADPAGTAGHGRAAHASTKAPALQETLNAQEADTKPA